MSSDEHYMSIGFTQTEAAEEVDVKEKPVDPNVHMAVLQAVMAGVRMNQVGKRRIRSHRSGEKVNPALVAKEKAEKRRRKMAKASRKKNR